MKHADKKKLASMLCVSVLSVSSFFGCAYGPDAEHSLVENFSLDLNAIAEQTAQPAENAALQNL